MAQAKRLQELGIVQKSLFLHFQHPIHGWRFGLDNDALRTWGSFAAFNTAELGIMLNVDCVGVLPEIFNTIEVNAWFEKITPTITYEAELRAAFLILALEQNLLTADEVNQRIG